MTEATILIPRLLLALLLGVSGYGAWASWTGARRRDTRWIRSGRNAVYLNLALAAGAYGFLTWYFLTDAFQVAYVARNSSTLQPLLYKFSAVWGGMDGSVLLWALILAGYSAACVYATRGRSPALLPYVTATLCAVMAFFAAVLVFASNPFRTLAFEPLEGAGLNPLLQNPGMMIHPPSLYLGYVGWTVPFAFAIAALVVRKLDAEWVVAARKWALVPWIFLTLGNLLGANWAYVELGWGGYWGWDPVENSAILPWFLGSAFLHSILIQEKRDMLRTWNVSLVVITFCATIMGTFVTRSGIIESVHTFSESPVGPIFLGFLAVLALGSAALIASRADLLRSPHRMESMLSRENAFLFNNLLLVGIAFAIWWGTFFPILSEAVTGRRISVGPPFFNQVIAPLGLALLALMGIGPLLAWRRSSGPQIRRQFAWPVAAGVAASLAGLVAGRREPYAVATFTFAAFTLTTVAQELARGTAARGRIHGEPRPLALARLVSRNRRRYGGYVVHVGATCVFLGLAGNVYVTSRELALQPGQRVRVGEYDVQFESLKMRREPNYVAAVAELAVSRGGGGVRYAHPEKRIYAAAAEEQVATEVAIDGRLLEDFYAILLEPLPGGAGARVKLVVNPLVGLVWLGGAVMVLGGVLSLTTRRPAGERAPRGMSRASLRAEREAVVPGA
ncbi:MAG: heme lyase CcmF/NrfE family subunit [Gemmatimonadetes bacterium]|nr:heme lyase CcmF/NrfE family subunit [Gemmatimonadota bacterium]